MSLFGDNNSKLAVMIPVRLPCFTATSKDVSFTIALPRESELLYRNSHIFSQLVTALNDTTRNTNCRYIFITKQLDHKLNTGVNEHLLELTWISQLKKTATHLLSSAFAFELSALSFGKKCVRGTRFFPFWSTSRVVLQVGYPKIR